MSWRVMALFSFNTLLRLLFFLPLLIPASLGRLAGYLFLMLGSKFLMQASHEPSVEVNFRAESQG